MVMYISFRGIVSFFESFFWFLVFDRFRDYFSYLIGAVLLKLLEELERDADHYFRFVSIGVGDV